MTSGLRHAGRRNAKCFTVEEGFKIELFRVNHFGSVLKLFGDRKKRAIVRPKRRKIVHERTVFNSLQYLLRNYKSGVEIKWATS